MAMDLTLTDWLASTEMATDADAATVASAGETLLRKEPVLPPVITAECHVRLASLRLRSSEPELANRHAVHAARLAFDMPAEAQLHVLPRALGLLRTSSEQIGDDLPAASQTIERGSTLVGDAMTAAINAADKGLIELAVIESLRQSSTVLPTEEGARIQTALGEHSARVSLQLETAGELALAARAGAIGFATNPT